MMETKSSESTSSKSDAPVEQTEFITYQLSRLNAKLTRQASTILKKNSDLTLVQWRIVSIIATFEECTFSEIVELSGMDAGLASRNINSLIESGDIDSEIDDRDHRRASLQLTIKGKNQHAGMLPIMRARQDLLVEGVDPKHLELFRQLIRTFEARAAIVNVEANSGVPA